MNFAEKIGRPRHYDKPAVEYPDAVQPVPEERIAPNFPYRGTNTHGVDPTNNPYTRTEQSIEETAPVYYEPAPPIEPVRVIIVRENAQEIASWHAMQMSVSPTAPAQIVGRDLDRKSVTIRNLSGLNTVYIGRQFSCSYQSGYPLDPGKDITLNSTDEVWGIAVDVQCLVAVLVQNTLIPADPQY